MGTARQQQEPRATEEEVTEAISAILTGTLVVSSAQAAIANLLLLLPLSWPGDLGTLATGAIARIILSGRDDHDDDNQEAFYKAQYAVNATGRIREALDGADSEGTDVERIRRALHNEARYHAQHLDASESRIAAKDMVSAARRRFGDTLGWHGIKDEVTDETCLKYQGKNFGADNPPKEGYPGTLHGGKCRCSVGAPFPNAEVIV